MWIDKKITRDHIYVFKNISMNVYADSNVKFISVEPGLCILVAMSLWHEFLCKNEMDWWMDCGIFTDFVLERILMIWENSSKIALFETGSSSLNVVIIFFIPLC